MKEAVRESGLPEPLGALVIEVVDRARLWRSERADVADELLAHLRDGLEAGADPGTLRSSFGEPALVAKLIRRAMRRKRPLAWRAGRRSLQGMGACACLVLVIYLYAALRFYGGTPKITHDYLAEINAAARSVAAGEAAWPVYRSAILSLRDLPAQSWEARPGEPGWPEATAGLESHAPALAMVRAAAARPGLGYVAGPAIDEVDRVLWPEHLDNRESNLGLISVVLPYLTELRRLGVLMATDMRRAAAAGDGTVVVADFEAGLGMARHARECPLFINDLVSVAQTRKALDTMAGIMAQWPGIFSEEQLHRLAHRVAALDRDRLRVRLDGEKLLFQDFLQRVYTDDGGGDGHLTAAWDSWLTLAQPVSISAPARQTTAGGSAPAAAPSPQAIEAQGSVLGPAAALVIAGRRDMAEMYARMIALVEAEAAKPLWEQKLEVIDRAVHGMQDSFIRFNRYLPVAILIPAFGHIGLHTEIAVQERDALLVAIALELYHRRSGAWPESLDALVPDLLPAVPRDRFDGEPLRYRLIDGKPLLYSIGWDRDDDGGKADAGPPGHPRVDGDWILWQVP